MRERLIWLVGGVLGVLGAVVVIAASAASSAAVFELRVAAQTSSTVTFAWDRRPAATGFQFFADEAFRCCRT